MTTLSFTNILVLSYNSLSYAAILFLLASGLSLIFGVMRIVNLAHAAFFLFAGYLALEFYNVAFSGMSLLPRIVQIASWALLYLAWRILARYAAPARAAPALLLAYAVLEAASSLLWGFRIFELFFPQVPVKPVDDVNFAGMIAAVVVALSVAALCGMFIERFFLRRLGQDTLAQVLVTIGFAFILQDGSLYTWGGDNFMLKQPWPLNHSAVLWGLSLPQYRAFMILVAVLVAAALFLGITSCIHEFS